MKKTMKHLLSLVMATSMAMAMSATAFAASTEKTYTLSNDESITFSDVVKVEEQTFSCYSFFDGDTTINATIVYIKEGTTFKTSSDAQGGDWFGFYGSTGLNSFYGGALTYDDATKTYSTNGETLDVISPITQEDFADEVFDDFMDSVNASYICLDSDFVEEMDGILVFNATYIALVDGDTDPTTAPVAPAVNTAQSTSSKVLVNGVDTSFEAYNIDDSNYFKLRDIAAALNGSAAGFEVKWNEELGAIEMLSGTGYTAVGGELVKTDASAKAYTTSTAKIYLDGVEVEMEAYEINGNNFFKLRDLGKAIGFSVEWDEAAQSIAIGSN